MKKLLAVIDYQNDFVDGSLGFAEAVTLEDSICAKIKEYKSEGADVLFTFDTHQEDYLNTQEGKKLPVVHCVENTKGHELYGKVADLCDKDKDICFNKVTFGSIDFADYLKENPYDLIEFVGVVSNICVISNIVLAKAVLPEAEIVVDAKCTASNDAQMNEKVLDVMGTLQVSILNR